MTDHATSCTYCGAAHSEHGLGLVLLDGPEGGVCIECGLQFCWSWFPFRAQSIFEMVDRIPWVPTELDATFWKLWNIDHWFANRKTVW